VQIKFTPIRVVCNNTLTMALSQGEALQVVHDTDLKKRIAAAQTLFAQVVSVYERIAKQFNCLAVIPVVKERLDTYLTGVFPDPAPPEPGKPSQRYDYDRQRADRDRRCCHALFDGSRNRQRGTNGTLWAAYNSVTEYVDHRYAAGNNRALNPSTRLQSMWFGKGLRYEDSCFRHRHDICRGVEELTQGRANHGQYLQLPAMRRFDKLTLGIVSGALLFLGLMIFATPKQVTEKADRSPRHGLVIGPIWANVSPNREWQTADPIDYDALKKYLKAQ